MEVGGACFTTKRWQVDLQINSLTTNKLQKGKRKATSKMEGRHTTISKKQKILTNSQKLNRIGEIAGHHLCSLRVEEWLLALNITDGNYINIPQ